MSDKASTVKLPQSKPRSSQPSDYTASDMDIKRDQQDDSSVIVLPTLRTMSEYKRTSAAGTTLTDLEEKELLGVMEEAGDFLVVAPPPDFAAIRKKFSDSLKVEYRKSAVLFACQMACQGFRGKDYFNTVKVTFKGKEVTLGEATEDKAVIQKKTKGTDVVNPRRICVAFSRIIRKYVRDKKVVTTSMKKYNCTADFMFIGGQGSITDRSDANKMVRAIFLKEGLASADKLVKYFQAVGVGADPISY